MPRSKKQPSRRPSAQTARRQPAERFHPYPQEGLSGEQVQQRVRQGLHNGSAAIQTKTEGQIIRENVLTFFNILNFALALAVILVGSFRSTVFLGVIFANIFIGSFQSIRAKRTLDKLSIVSAPKAVVMREGQRREIPVEQVVLDDILVLSAGNQVWAASGRGSARAVKGMSAVRKHSASARIFRMSFSSPGGVAPPRSHSLSFFKGFLPLYR